MSSPPGLTLLRDAPVGAPPPFSRADLDHLPDSMGSSGVHLFGDSGIPAFPNEMLDTAQSRHLCPPGSRSRVLPGVPDTPPGFGGGDDAPPGLRMPPGNDFTPNGDFGGVSQTDTGLICQFTCRCTFLSPDSISTVKVHSPQLDAPFVMEQAHFDKTTWLACISVPRNKVTFSYKYFVENRLGICWEEERQHRIVYLKTDSSSVSLDDTIESGIVV